MMKLNYKWTLLNQKQDIILTTKTISDKGYSERRSQVLKGKEIINLTKVKLKQYAGFNQKAVHDYNF